MFEILIGAFIQGYEVLKRISEVIGQARRSTLEQLSG